MPAARIERSIGETLTERARVRVTATRTYEVSKSETHLVCWSVALLLAIVSTWLGGWLTHLAVLAPLLPQGLQELIDRLLTF